jgi:adenine-specific DNA-methyltransferase
MKDYLNSQIITYMGNKRKLLKKIEEILIDLEGREGRKLSIGDGFSGSGIVSRLFKTRASELFTNDISDYSETLNKSFLTNVNENESKIIEKYVNTANRHADKCTKKYSSPYVSGNWAPIGSIVPGDRVYFTEENGKRIDTLRNYIDTLPEKYKPYLLASLIVESSIHNNTNGQFSAFHKNGNIGQYGGKNSVDIRRITQPIMLKVPISHNNKCAVNIQKQDTNNWVKEIPELDLVYYDPPYNKHPYIIFYFLLNIINNWKRDTDIPDTYRGQPLDWEKSLYNSSKHAEATLTDLIQNTNSKYILLSYNNGGIIPLSKLDKILKDHGSVEKIPVDHKTYNRMKGISEYKRTSEKKAIEEYFWLLTKTKH